MLEYKQNVAARVPVRLLDAGGSPVTGVAFGSVAAAVEKSDGTTAVLSVTAPDWVEVTAGAFSGLGKYDLIIPNTATNLTGVLSYAVTATGAVGSTYIVKIVANEEADTYSRVGAPVGASISADVAAVKSDTGSTLTTVGTISTNVSAVDTKLGTPAGASVSADIAAVFARIGTPAGASAAADIAAIFARLGAPAGASTAADIAAIFARIGTPAGASVSADVAAVKSDTGTINTKVGTPAGASVSADIAAVNTNVNGVTTNVNSVNTKLGTPAAVTVSADIAAVKAETAAINTDTIRLRKHATNRKRVDPGTNTQIVYEDDGTTPLDTWDIKDSAGAPTSTDPFDRVPV